MLFDDGVKNKNTKMFEIVEKLFSNFYGRKNKKGDASLNQTSQDEDDYFQNKILKLMSDIDKLSEEKLAKFINYFKKNVEDEAERIRKNKSNPVSIDVEENEFFQKLTSSEKQKFLSREKNAHEELEERQESVLKKKESKLKSQRVKNIMNSCLNEKENQIITLFYWEDKNCGEIAKIMGISTGSLTPTKIRAENKLRKFLKDID
jgi:RNA polymerase sigma factor (sigma-70 family)